VELAAEVVGVGSRRSWFLRWRFSALVVAVMSAAVLSGCGGASVSQSASGRAALLGTLENWSALETSVDQATGILTQQCMAEHGLRYYPFPQAGQPGGPPQFATQLFGSSLWLGPQSLAWRSVNGWGLYEDTMQRLGQPGGFFGGQPAEFRVMCGCNTSAGRQLFGSVAGVGCGSALRAVDSHRQYRGERWALAGAAGERGWLGRLHPRPHANCGEVAVADVPALLRAV
jgi:hypothetical protein